MKVNRPKIKGIRGRPAVEPVEPGDNAPARIEPRQDRCMHGVWLADHCYSCEMDMAKFRAAQPANTDDRQADTIPDLKEAIGALIAWWDHLQDECPIEKYIDTFRAALSGRAETRIEVLEAALREILRANPYADDPVEHICRAALAAPSGETP